MSWSIIPNKLKIYKKIFNKSEEEIRAKSGKLRD